MKFYIAASFPRRLEVLTIAEGLIKKGHQITSRWMHDTVFKPCIERAIRDLKQIEEADIFVTLIGDDQSHGGRHTELGIAIANGKIIHLIGLRTQVFHYLIDKVWQFNGINGYLNFIHHANEMEIWTFGKDGYLLHKRTICDIMEDVTERLSGYGGSHILILKEGTPLLILKQ